LYPNDGGGGLPPQILYTHDLKINHGRKGENMDYLDKLKTMSTAKIFPKNTTIIKEGGDTPYSMFIILSGAVDVYKNHGDYDEVIIATLEPGDFFGEMSLFLLEPRSATIIAKVETIALEINPDNALKIIGNYPEIPYNMIKTLCKRVQTLNNRVAIRYPRNF
jgi:CRP-like cAMP-binding protein